MSYLTTTSSVSDVVLSDIILSPTTEVISPVSPVVYIDKQDKIITMSPISPVSPVFLIEDTVVSPTMINNKPAVALNLNYSRPMYSLDVNLNKDKRIQKTMVKYFQTKTLDKWLTDSFSHILGYFEIKNGRVELVKDFSKAKKYDITKEKRKHIDMKIDFIEKYFLTESVIYRVLDKIVDQTGITWAKLHDNSYVAKKMIRLKLEKLIKNADKIRRNKNK